MSPEHIRGVLSRRDLLARSANGFGASWGADGTIFATLDVVGALSKIPANGGQPTPLMELKPPEAT